MSQTAYKTFTKHKCQKSSVNTNTPASFLHDKEFDLTDNEMDPPLDLLSQSV